MSPKSKKTRTASNSLAELHAMRPRPTMPAQPDPPPPAEADARRYRDLLDVAVSLASSLDLKAILDAIVDGIIRVTGSDRGFVILRESNGDLTMFTGRARDGAPWDRKFALEISDSVVNRVVETHDAFVGDDIAKIQELREQESILAQKIRSAVCLPLIYQDRLIGVIYADSSFVIARFGESDRELLRAFGAQAALAVANAQHHGEVQEQNRILRQQLSQQVNMSGMVTRNQRMLDVFAVVEKIARSDMQSVLIRGESGTGKELIARAIHERSARRAGPFVAVNCSAIPPTLFESTLFGHIRGAFTGADADRAGHFEAANGGTLFLDEIGDLPLEVQPRLLRALQQREITRVGETGTRPIDVRVVTATNRDLPRAVEQGEFRADLYYRLNTAQLYLPPLRERPEDILPLAEYFLQRLAEKSKQPAPQLSRDARRYLLANRWDGNVRELENVMEWAVAFQDEHGVVHASAFERPGSAPDSTAAVEDTHGQLKELMERFEERLIRDALARNDSNVSNTARALGISRQVLHLKINKYGIVTRDD